MGHGKKDDLKGGNGDDTLVGTGDPDSISGGNGNDLIFGYGADGDPPDIDPDGGGENDNDKIKAGNGDDTVHAGGGNDDVEAGNGDDTVYAGGGNDEIKAGNGDDTVHAGDGNDDVEAGNGDDVVFAGAGNDEIKAGNGDDTVHAGGGNDEIKAGNGDDRIDGGSGDDFIDGGNGFDTAALQGTFDEYEFSFEKHGKSWIFDGPSGRDTLKSVEAVEFEDGYTLLLDGTNNTPYAVGDAITTDEDSATLVGSAALLANDIDFEGDALRVASVGPAAFGQVTASLSPDGSIASVAYDPNGQFESLAAGETATDTFGYTVADGNGGTDTATATVTITGVNDGPNAVADAGAASEDGPAISIDLTGNDSDPDASDDLEVIGLDTTGALGAVLINPDGEGVTYDPNGQFESLAAGETAADTFSYTVADGNGGTDTATATVTITGVNDGPNAVADTGAASEDGPAISIDLTGNDSDPDASDDLEVIGLDTTGALGAVLINPDGEGVTYDPNGQFESLAAGETAAETFSYTVADGNGGTDTATATVTITGVNDGPNAVADAGAASEDGPAISIDLTGNDSDPDASDDLEVIGLDTTGALGAVLINPDGEGVTYDPNGQFESLAAGETAADTFSYTVADGNGGTDTATATVTITGVNDGPNAVADTGAASEDGPAISIDLTGNDSDPDASDDLEVIGLDTTGALGAVLINPDGEGVTYDPNGQFESLAAGETAADTFSYTVADGNGGTDTATATVTITGVNDGPTFAAEIFVFAIDENNAAGAAVGAAIATDPDGDTLTYAIVENADANPGNDVPFAVDAAGAITATAALDFEARATWGFTLQATDAAGLDETAAVIVEVEGVEERTLDIVTTNVFDDSVSLLLGDGAGGFTDAGANPAVGGFPVSVALGDLNGDGILDIVTVDGNDESVSVLLGAGGGFTDAGTNPAVGEGPNSVALGDLDGDGDLDIVTANQFSDNVSVLLGDGDGGFTDAGADLPVGDFPGSVALGDVDGDGDGDLDIVATNDFGDSVSVLLGDGGGGFSDAGPDLAVGSIPESVALGDLDGDGDLDIVTANRNGHSVSVLLGDGAGGFTDAGPDQAVGLSPKSVALGDLDGDGDLDIVTASAAADSVTVLFGDGVGGFTDAGPDLAVGGEPRSVALGDVDGDGDLDIVTANVDDDSVSVLLGDGAGGFTDAGADLAVGDGPSSVALGDLDGPARLTASGLPDLGLDVPLPAEFDYMI